MKGKSLSMWCSFKRAYFFLNAAKFSVSSTNIMEYQYRPADATLSVASWSSLDCFFPPLIWPCSFACRTCQPLLLAVLQNIWDDARLCRSDGTTVTSVDGAGCRERPGCWATAQLYAQWNGRSSIFIQQKKDAWVIIKSSSRSTKKRRIMGKDKNKITWIHYNLQSPIQLFNRK